MKKTLILGASTNPERYAFKAAKMLLGKGHEIELLGNKVGQVFEHEIKTKTSEISSDIDTITMYLSPKNQEQYRAFILELNPKRVVFNPGAENPEFVEELNEAGIETLEACTLVLLSTKQY